MTERCPHCKRAIFRPVPKRRTTPRKGPMRDPGYRRWCKQQACAISGVVAGQMILCVRALGPRRAVIDPAHTERNGAGSKGPDSSCLPLERALHDEYDANRLAFEKKHVNMRELARESYQRYLIEKGLKAA